MASSESESTITGADLGSFWNIKRFRKSRRRWNCKETYLLALLVLKSLHGFGRSLNRRGQRVGFGLSGLLAFSSGTLALNNQLVADSLVELNHLAEIAHSGRGGDERGVVLGELQGSITNEGNGLLDLNFLVGGHRIVRV